MYIKYILNFNAYVLLERKDIAFLISTSDRKRRRQPSIIAVETTKNPSKTTAMVNLHALAKLVLS